MVSLVGLVGFEGMGATELLYEMKNDELWEEMPDLLFAGPTFDALIRKGERGRLHTTLLRREIERTLTDVLADIDHEAYPAEKGKNAPRWRTDIRAQAERWRKPSVGLICPGEQTGRGIWQITEKGRRSFEINRTDLIERGHINPEPTGWNFTEKGKGWWRGARLKKGH
jgi:hypothetical protein